MSNPFLSSTSKPGHGLIHLGVPRLRTLSYQYPLKLVSPAPQHLSDADTRLVQTVYLLTYGGGLVAGDTIDLHVTLEPDTRLILLTQGSTKLFKAPKRSVLSRQCMAVDLTPGSALCYLPDPVQPFEHSNFEQRQIYNILPSGDGTSSSSLCALDWVSNGRPANGENWSFYRYGSRNELYLHGSHGKRRLLLRDNVILDDHEVGGSVAQRMDGQAVFGTLLLHGPLFQHLGEFFMNEFKQLPRIGGRKWDSGSESGEDDVDHAAIRRAARQRQASLDGVLWSAASVRNCVVVKLGAREVEGGRSWLRSMLVEEGSVVRHFGERALMCLR